jgi:hypothetical protein
VETPEATDVRKLILLVVIFVDNYYAKVKQTGRCGDVKHLRCFYRLHMGDDNSVAKK